MTNNTIPSPISVYYAWQKSIFRDEILRKLAGEGLKRKPADIRATAFCMATHGMNGQHCHPSIDTMAEQLGFGRDTIINHLKILVDQGWFTAVKRHRTSTDYSIAIPDPEVTPRLPSQNLESDLVRPKNPVESDQNLESDSLESDLVPPLESDLVRHHQDIDQEHIDQETVTSVTVNQESRISIRLDQENILESRPEAALGRQEEKVKGPWCSICDTPLISNGKTHNHEYDWICTSCGAIDCVEFSFSDAGKPRFKCIACQGYIVARNGVLTAKTAPLR